MEIQSRKLATRTEPDNKDLIENKITGCGHRTCGFTKKELFLHIFFHELLKIIVLLDSLLWKTTVKDKIL